MKIYSAHGVNDFVVCLGYRGYMIKEYFANYFLHTCDVTFDIGRNEMEVHHSTAEPWRVTLVDTGEQTQTGGRLRRVLHYVGDEEFCFTYGDGVSSIDIGELIRFHREQDVKATVTAVQPPGRFGALETSTTARARLPGEAPRRRRLDQRRVLRPVRRHRRLHRRRRHGLGARADGAAGAPRDSWRPTSTTGSGTRWTRCATRCTSRSCGAPGARRGRSGSRPRLLARASGCWSPATPASREAGSRCGSPSWARTSRGYSVSVPDRALAVRAGPRRRRRCARSRATCATATRWSAPFAESRPEIVIHMAAQSLVRRSYRDPVETYETNVLGTVNVLEAVRARDDVRVVVNVTTDKVYENHESERGLPRGRAEGRPRPLQQQQGVLRAGHRRVPRLVLRRRTARRVASARAGNVIGGGDWGEDRLIPDLMRGVLSGRADADPQSRRGAPVAARAEPAERLSHPGRADVGLARATRRPGTSAPTSATRCRSAR